MKPRGAHIVDRVDDLVLGLLEAAEAAEAREHAARCLDCAAALGQAEEIYQLSSLSASPAAPPAPSLRERILASAASSNRFERFAQRVSELIEVTRDKAASLLRAIDDATSWEDSPWPGVRLFHLPAGPDLADAVVGFVRLPGGNPFPEHHHLGQETTLVLQGSARDSSGAITRAGDEIASAAETGHHFEALPGPDYIYLVVVRRGVRFADGTVIGAGDPRM